MKFSQTVIFALLTHSRVEIQRKHPDLPLTSAPIPQKKILFLCWKINYPLLTAIHYGFLPYPHIPHSFWNLNQKYQASSTLRFQLFNKRLKFVEQ